MFFKNLKYFWRSIKRDKTFSLINLFGMTVGILVILLAGFYAFYQLSYDKFIKDHDRIYRLEYVSNYLENITHSSFCSHNLANILKDEVPGIREVITIQKLVSLNLSLNCEGNPVILDNWMMVSENFLEYYDVEFIRGTRDSGLENGKSLLITESLANRFFAGQNPLGKELKFQKYNATKFIISGIIKDLPANSHIRADAIALDYSFWPEREPEDDYDPQNLVTHYKYTYLVLDNNSSINQVLKRFPEIKRKYLSSFLEKQGYDLELTATQLSQTHFKQDIFSELPTENIDSIYYFLLIAFIVINISIINFINLSLARFAGRNVDIGIRKTLGATRIQIFWQYISESGLFVLFSFVLALLAFCYLLPVYSEFMGLELQNARFSTSGFLLLIPVLLVVVFLAGFYPSFMTARRNPQIILQNKSTFRSRKGNRFFIVLQLILSIIFFVVTIVIFLQLDFSKKESKGFNLENVIAYEYYNFGPNMPQTNEICDMLKRSAYINDVAVSTKLPGQELLSGLINVELPKETIKLDTEIINIDHNYLPFAEIDLLYGRNFNEDLASDSSKVIVNTTFAKTFGSVENAVGKRVYFPKANENEEKLDAEIIGVVNDFHFHSMHREIKPLIIIAKPYAPNYYHIKYDQRNLKFVLEDVEKVFAELAAHSPLSPKKHFPEEELLKQYETDIHLSLITIWLAALSIILAILGVFGLTAFIIRSNMKMLCIRKVFGADTINLFKLLLQDYSIILFTANLIAIPLAWYVCTKWLERFAYHISLPVWLFVGGIMMSVLIVVTAISYHMWNISKIEPIVYLKDE